MNATYSIFASDFEQFTKLVENANKKARKLGVPEYTVTASEPYQVEKTYKGNTYYEVRRQVTIVGSTPKYNGWSLVGVISPITTETGDLVPVVTTVPGSSVKNPMAFSDALWCDQCKVRRDRLESFIVQHEDGTEKQVGRNCLKDFLGDVRMSPAGLANLMNTLASISTSVAEWHKGPRRFHAESLTTVLACTIAAIRHHGWLSSREAYYKGGTSTKSRMGDILSALINRPEEGCEDYEVLMANWSRNHAGIIPTLPTDADFDSAIQYREQAMVLLDQKEEAGGMNDYLNSIRAIVSAGAVNKRTYGIACSIVPFVDRETGTGNSIDPLKARVADAQKNSKFVGEAKKREVFSGVTFVENFQTSSGMTVATFLTADGNLLKAFSHQSLKPGTVVDIKATVVRHDTYKNTNQTIVNRIVVQ